MPQRSHRIGENGGDNGRFKRDGTRSSSRAPAEKGQSDNRYQERGNRRNRTEKKRNSDKIWRSDCERTRFVALEFGQKIRGGPE